MIAGPGVIDQGPSSMIGKGKSVMVVFFIIGRVTFLLAEEIHLGSLVD
jgi:hypothetical protein